MLYTATYYMCARSDNLEVEHKYLLPPDSELERFRRAVMDLAPVRMTTIQRQDTYLVAALDPNLISAIAMTSSVRSSPSGAASQSAWDSQIAHGCVSLYSISCCFRPCTKTSTFPDGVGAEKTPCCRGNTADGWRNRRM